MELSRVPRRASVDAPEKRTPRHDVHLLSRRLGAWAVKAQKSVAHGWNAGCRVSVRSMNHALARQVDSLGDRMEGWFDDRFEPYSGTALAWLAGVLDHLVTAFGVSIPYLYPMPQGFVRAGWVTSRWTSSPRST